MGKILVSTSHFDTLCRRAWDLLESNGHQVIYDPSRTFPAYRFEELRELVGDIDAAIIGMDVYDEAVFRLAPKLKAVAKFGVGVDNIDLAAASRFGVKVLNAPGQNANAVAELTVGCILSLLRSTLSVHREMEQGGWPRVLGQELRGKTVGLIGFGAIARLVARKLAGFDVALQAYDIFMDEPLARSMGVRIARSAEEVITTSDIVSLHIPAGKENYHLFDRAMFGRMRRGSYLINAARGGLVDLDALCGALRSGQLAGAALDAFETEPLPAGAEIFRSGNVICTPHIGSETREAYDSVSLCVAEGVVDVLAGRIPQHWVNRPGDAR